MPLPKNLSSLVQQVSNPKLPMNKRQAALTKLEEEVNADLKQSEAHFEATIADFDAQWAKFLKVQTAFDEGLERVMGSVANDAEIDKIVKEMTAEIEKEKIKKGNPAFDEEDILKRIANLQDVTPQQVKQNIQQIAREGKREPTRPSRPSNYLEQAEYLLEQNKQANAQFEELRAQQATPPEKTSFVERLIKGFKDLFSSVQVFFGRGSKQTEAPPRPQESHRKAESSSQRTSKHQSKADSSKNSDPDLHSDQDAKVQETFKTLCQERDLLDEGQGLTHEEEKELEKELNALIDEPKAGSPRGPS